MDLDELECVALPLAGHCAQESVLVMMPSARAANVFKPIWCTVDAVGDEPAQIHFEPEWRETTGELGYPFGELWVENLLEALARVEFLRRHPR